MTEIFTKITPELLNKEISMKGLAVVSKAGACIKLAEDIVFIQNKHDWEDEELNKIVVVTGTLVEKKFIPDPVIDEDGAISQGAEGTQFVLEGIKKIEFK
ncbi:MAG: hypothetical protein ACTSO7_08620 [Candidatus Heimdallarchaeota archaeon]